MILDASAFRVGRPLRAILLSTPFVGSSLFGGQFQSSVEEATHSQEKLSQVRRLASACSRVAQGTAGARAPQPSQKRGGDGLTFLYIPGLVWDTQLGIAQKGLFPVGGRLSFFLPAWQ